MFVLLSLLVGSLTIFALLYPLLFKPVKSYLNNDKSLAEFNEQESLLSAITELDHDYELGRLSVTDYEHLKLYFQRKYLEEKQSIESS
ncbi:MAG: hypothetical protein HQM12_01295 [SAR324 cluster bacterium]|nr:hypothetical protein [SAR324 cluster bacterium]MBF0351612.1 hypothetical protein [SAR324 cluster bacterium]